MNKAEIRKRASKRRQALSAAQVQHLTEQLLSSFSSLDFKGIKVIHLFLPIEKKKEPNTFLFIDWLKAHHPDIKIIVPRADFDTALMTHHEYTGAASLVKNLFHILEPQNINPHTGPVDMVLIPLLAFDRRGYRVGYGKGFYDRFLQGNPAQKIGLSFFAAEEDIITDIDPHDVKMDRCLSPQHLYIFD